MRSLVLWSAPRSRSTAFERMMRERGDFEIVHEPFSHLADYGSAMVAGREITTAAELLTALTNPDRDLFVKDTTDFHYPHVLADRAFLAGATHVFLIRHPREAIASHAKLNPDLGRDEIGFAWLWEIFAAVRDASGAEPVVVDSDDLVARPEPTIAQFCERVGIEYRPEALHWDAGMVPGWQRSERWHQDTSASTTFAVRDPHDDGTVEASPVLSGYLDYHLPFYERLYAHRLRIA